MRLIAQVVQPLKIKRRNLKVDAKQKGRTIALFSSLNTEGRMKSSLPFDTRRDLLSAVVELGNKEVNFSVIVLRSIL